MMRTPDTVFYQSGAFERDEPRRHPEEGDAARKRSRLRFAPLETTSHTILLGLPQSGASGYRSSRPSSAT
jgi:hypothetical protein